MILRRRLKAGNVGGELLNWIAMLERDGFRLNRHRALDLWWSMIFSENR
jgi:hypothetical protein